MIEIILILLCGLTGLTVVCLFSWYRIVSPMEAHLVVSPKGKFVVSPDENTGTQRWYFAIPNWIPFIGRQVRIMDMTVKEIIETQETIEEGQARYNVTSSTKFRIGNVIEASEKFVSFGELKPQLQEVIRASVREVTVKYDVVTARAKKSEISAAIKESMVDDFADWGVTLTNFQLVDFMDTADSKIISNISLRREKEIESTTRQQNAEKLKTAKIKEAEADEKSQQREIERDQKVGEYKQLKDQKISEMEKVAKEKAFEVKQVEIIKQAEIDKEKAIVEANQAKEQEEILKKQKQLEGEGDRLREEEKAKGAAAPIREKGLAEAEAKEKLQAALNKFKPEAIRALTAELIVAKEEAVGIATAKALSDADLKVFAGGSDGRAGFNFSELLGAARSSGDKTDLDALLNRVARPNDIGLNIDLSNGNVPEPVKKPVVVPDVEVQTKKAKK